jgi:hypothetical protein
MYLPAGKMVASPAGQGPAPGGYYWLAGKDQSLQLADSDRCS